MEGALVRLSRSLIDMRGDASGVLRRVAVRGGVGRGGDIAPIDTKSAGSGSLIRFGLSNAARSGSRTLRLKLASPASPSGGESTTTPLSQPAFGPDADKAARTSLVTFDVERSRTDVSFSSGSVLRLLYDLGDL